MTQEAHLLGLLRALGLPHAKGRDSESALKVRMGLEAHVSPSPGSEHPNMMALPGLANLRHWGGT